MTRMGTRSRLAGALALSAMVLMLPLAVLADDADRGDQDREPQAEKQETEKKLDVFELEHRTPQEMSQLLRMKAGQHGHDGHLPPDPAAIGAPEAAQIVAVQDGDEPLLFVRGPEEKVEEIREIVEALDVAEEDLEKQSFDDVHFIPVPNGRALQAHTVLNHLRIPSQVVQFQEAETGLVVIRAEEDDDTLSHAETVIEMLTAEEEAEDEAEPDDEPEQENDEGTDV